MPEWQVFVYWQVSMHPQNNVPAVQVCNFCYKILNLVMCLKKFPSNEEKYTLLMK